MVDAVILLCVLPGEEQAVKEKILELEQVEKCLTTFGEYDLIVDIQNICYMFYICYNNKSLILDT